MLGSLNLAENLGRLGIWIGVYAVAFVPVAVLSSRMRPGRVARLAGALAAATLVLVALANFHRFRPGEVVRPLPIFLAALVTGILVRLARHPRGRAAPPGEVLRLMLLVFSGLLLVKILFRVLLADYGFALAMPGTLMMVAALVSWLPRWVEERGGAAGPVRAVSVAAVGVTLLAVVLVVDQRFSSRTFRVGAGPDKILAGPTALPVARALKEIETRLAPQDTLAVLPEGVMLNYLSRHANPTGHINFMPPELLMFGEPEILAAFEEAPPDFIVLAHKDAVEYGVRFFGTDYGRPLYQWVRARYHVVWRAGAKPFSGPRFGVELLERNDRLRQGFPAVSRPPHEEEAAP